MAIILTLIVRLAALAGTITAVFACAYAASSHAPVQFDTAKEARSFLMAKGFYCHNGSMSTSAAGNFYVADHPVGYDDFLPIVLRHKCGMTPKWKGVVRVSQIDNPSQRHRLEPQRIGGKTRIWGNVLAAGDEDLLDRIEEFVMNQ